MDSFVLDASIAFSWCFPADPTENMPYSRAVLQHLEVADALVPEVWPFEIANIIFVASAKRKRISEAQIREFPDTLKASRKQPATAALRYLECRDVLNWVLLWGWSDLFGFESGV